jgi:hypothetical protein
VDVGVGFEFDVGGDADGVSGVIVVVMLLCARIPDGGGGEFEGAGVLERDAVAEMMALGSRCPSSSSPEDLPGCATWKSVNWML